VRAAATLASETSVSLYLVHRADGIYKAESNFQLLFLCACADGAKTRIDTSPKADLTPFDRALTRGANIPTDTRYGKGLRRAGSRCTKTPSCNVNLVDRTPSDDTSSMERR
jgi:hypothetical protein